MTFVRLHFEVLWHAAWVGVFWDVEPCTDVFVIAEGRHDSGRLVEQLVHPRHLHIYLCLVPFVALHAEFALSLRRVEEREDP